MPSNTAPRWCEPENWLPEPRSPRSVNGCNPNRSVRKQPAASNQSQSRRTEKNHVGSAAPGCPVQQSSTTPCEDDEDKKKRRVERRRGYKRTAELTATSSPHAAQSQYYPAKYS